MSEPATDRRSAIKTAAIGGIGLTAGAVLGGGAVAATAGPAEAERRTVVVEVATLGDTTRSVPFPLLARSVELAELDEGDLRGGPWYMEGIMYPEGTILGDGFIPTDTGQIGIWFCRGSNINHPGRADPHLVTEQQFLFGSLADEPLGAKLLISTGIEGRNRPTWRAHRAVVGGTGEYRGATGEVVQEQISTNATEFPFGGKAPNFRFEFDVDIR